MAPNVQVREGWRVRTDLVQPTLIGEDGDVPVIASASYMAGKLSVVGVRTERALGTFAHTRHDGSGCICVVELFSFFGSSR
jgi:hypothetical protein